MGDRARIVGIVLRAMDYQETKRLITLFSPTGLWHLVISRLSSKRAASLLASSPFSKSECIVKQSRAELLSCSDLSLLNGHQALRTRYAFLQAAGALAQALLQTQLPGKAAPQLYRLFEVFLHHIPSLEEHAALIASFQLKLLKHEGQLQLSTSCMFCAQKPAMLLKGESVCSAHVRKGGVSFSEHEWLWLLALCNARLIEELTSISLPQSFVEKVQQYFYGSI